MTAPEKRLASPSPMALAVARMTFLERAAGYLGGQDRLATALGIQGRSVRAKISADRRVSDDDLELAALAMEARAADILREVGKIRKVIADGR